MLRIAKAIAMNKNMIDSPLTIDRYIYYNFHKQNKEMVLDFT
jgi:hypothetical protein